MGWATGPAGPSRALRACSAVRCAAPPPVLKAEAAAALTEAGVAAPGVVALGLSCLADPRRRPRRRRRRRDGR